jgi:hypothetical protein
VHPHPDAQRGDVGIQDGPEVLGELNLVIGLERAVGAPPTAPTTRVKSSGIAQI